MYQPMSSLGLGDLYQGAARTTAEKTNPAPGSAPAAQVAANTGTAVAGAFGVQLPVLIALGVIAVALVRYYD